jgi:hypothetical protein
MMPELIGNMRGKMHFHVAKSEEASADFKRADARLVRKWGDGAPELRIDRRDDQERGDAFNAWKFHRDAATMYAAVLQAEIAIEDRIPRWG